MPVADLLSSTLLHILPVDLLLLSAAVLTQSDPSHHLFALHAASVIDGDQQGDVRQLEQRHLEHESLLVDGVGLSATHRRFTARNLLTHRVQKGQTSIGVWEKEGEEVRGHLLSRTHKRRLCVETPKQERRPF